MELRDDGKEAAVHSLREQFSKMRQDDWKALVLLAASFIPGKIWKLFSSDIWVVSEYEHLARDNGYWLFKYIRENYPEQKVYYPISEISPDYQKIHVLGNEVSFGSFKHYCLFWAANKYIGTTKCYGFPYRRICEDLVQWNIHRFKYIFLNHGFTRGYSSIVDKKETRYDLVNTCSEKDRRIIIEDNHQDPSVVKDLGFPRHDHLGDELLNKKQILIMPTWRNWLDNRLKRGSEKRAVENSFLSSDYYRKYQDLITDKALISFLEENDLKLIFYLHEYAQGYAKDFTVTSQSVTVGTNDKYDIQELLKSSALLITDYSSVCYDFAYMYKPVIYYQFDKKEFEQNQYAPGDSFSYEKDGFGEIVFDETDLISQIKKKYSHHFEMEDKYKERVNSFFEYHDHNNCERVYKAIREL